MAMLYVVLVSTHKRDEEKKEWWDLMYLAGWAIGALFVILTVL